MNHSLLGAFIVDPKERASYPAYDSEHIMVLNDLNLGFTINGKGFPATDAVAAKKGEKVLVRFLNEGTLPRAGASRRGRAAGCAPTRRPR